MAACEGLAEGDACHVELRGRDVGGICVRPPAAPASSCELHVRGLIPDEDLAAACDGLAEDEACSMVMPDGPTLDGTCTPTESLLLCDVVLWTPGGDEPPPTGLARDPIWKPCTVRFEGRTWWHVGVRFKGYSTLKETWAAGSYKLPLRLEFDQFEDEYPEIRNQRFFGFQTLSFFNNALDDSLIREKVLGDVLRESGVPAPRSAFYRVYIDVDGTSRYFGLYTVVEVPDRPMFLTQFGGAGGNLYKPDGLPWESAATWRAGLPIDETSFPKKSNRAEADWSDIQAAIAALNANRSDASAWRDELDRRFDAAGFLRWLAINTVVQNWDSYGITCRNYYLYGDPSEGGKLHWIPWDQNLSFRSDMSPAPLLPIDMSTVDARFPLIRFLMDDPVYIEIYWSEVGRFDRGLFAPDRIKERLRATHDLVAPHVVGPEGELPGYTWLRDPDAFTSSLDALQAHVDLRHTAVAEALAGRP